MKDFEAMSRNFVVSGAIKRSWSKKGFTLRPAATVTGWPMPVEDAQD
jgi:hypothetical protein